MGESFKAVCSLLMIIALIVTVLFWFEDRPDRTTWIVRFTAPLIGLMILAIVLKVHFRKDREPDYLRTIFGNYFNRGGFCFAMTASAQDGICHLHAHFQNQHERPCVGRIALRPSRGFFLTRAKIDAIMFEVPCEGGAFGVVTLPIPLPRAVLGTEQSFDVAAWVSYPKGRGRRLRFRDGILVRGNTEMGVAATTGLILAGALAGMIVIPSSPAKMTIQLPDEAVDELSPSCEPQTRVHWRLGDPPLENLKPSSA